jgi:hypothetical protein
MSDNPISERTFATRLREIPVLLDKAPIRYSRTAAEACLKAADGIEASWAALKEARAVLVIVAENGGNPKDPALKVIKKIDAALAKARGKS